MIKGELRNERANDGANNCFRIILLCWHIFASIEEVHNQVHIGCQLHKKSEQVCAKSLAGETPDHSKLLNPADHLGSGEFDFASVVNTWLLLKRRSDEVLRICVRHIIWYLTLRHCVAVVHELG